MTATRALVVGTRGSRLARIQTDIVLGLLTDGAPASGGPVHMGGGARATFEVKVLRTEGDRTQAQNTPLDQLPRGVFVKELEAALLEGSIDLAVHSLKDMTTVLDPGLAIAAIPEREDPRDVLVSRRGRKLKDLSEGACVGTSSPRRAAQLKALRSDVRFESIRGNVDTRVRKVDDGEYDAAVLAAAGLARLGLADRIAQYFEPDECLPDPGQGALAVQVRAEDRALIELLAPLNHRPTWAAVTAERALMRELGGGCKVPIGALAEVETGGETLLLRGLVASPGSSEVVRSTIRGPVGEPEAAGKMLADLMRKRGADRLLEQP